MPTQTDLPTDLKQSVQHALAEDLGTGDITAALLDPHLHARGQVICREAAVLCGAPWFDEVFRQVDAGVRIKWQFHDGDEIAPDAVVCELEGPARALLSGERTALNFLQLLSGVATSTRRLVKLIAGTRCILLDTRKTLPGLRAAQKYAVRCGGGDNHRAGLYDAVLIKENHIRALGGIAAAVRRANARHDRVEVEVENLEELRQAIEAGARHVLLDNFTLEALRQAVTLNAGRARLEASGGIDETNIRAMAETAVDYISVGSLTKHVRAVDFSLQFEHG